MHAQAQETKRESGTQAGIKHEIKENVESLAQDIRQKAGKVADSARERTSEYYDTASSWMRNNYGKALIAAGILAVAGVTTYFFMKKRRDRMDVEL